MSVWSRVTDLMAANINALLDKAEDPILMLAQMVRDMEQELTLARSQAATVIAAARRLSRELEQHKASSRQWKERARLALASGRENLARQALAHKIDSDDLAARLEEHCIIAQQNSVEIKSALHTLETHLAEARRKQRTLLSQQQLARVCLQAQQTVGNRVSRTCSPFGKFSFIEDKLLDMEDLLLAQVEIHRLDDETTNAIEDLGLKKRLDDEIESLRRDSQTGGP